jgi:hypothetical protein
MQDNDLLVPDFFAYLMAVNRELTSIPPSTLDGFDTRVSKPSSETQRRKRSKVSLSWFVLPPTSLSVSGLRHPIFVVQTLHPPKDLGYGG